MPVAHKPRRGDKPTPAPTAAADPSSAGLVVATKQGRVRPAFPLVAFLWPARSGVSQWVVLPVILLCVGLFRWAVGLWGYSGLAAPPMHGDFEAQRHWMELTTHLPLSRWYFYDLEYWGLDYPPLTAYHSWLLGRAGSLIDARWFALDTSRGCEAPALKVFMRASVLLSEYLVYVPAVAILLRCYVVRHRTPAWVSYVALAAVLLQPATLLVDHGHFQYNTVMLGFVVAAVESIEAGRLLWSCIFFVAALGFKQMALYFAPAVFAFLLGSCLSPRFRPCQLLSIALVTLASFGLLVAPFVLLAGRGGAGAGGAPPPPPLTAYLPACIERSPTLRPAALQLAQVVHRVFPFARGLFEDKVANAWCALHTAYKLHGFSAGALQRASLAATALAALPAFATLLARPRRELLLPGLASCAWAFFLFAFQVHEKSVLLPLLPMTLLLATPAGLGGGGRLRAWVGWANVVGAFTLFPLLRRDGLAVPYAVTTLLWAYLLGLPPTSLALYVRRQSNGPAADSSSEEKEGSDGELAPPAAAIHLATYAALLAWHAGEALVPPPPTKPDLWPVLNALLGAAAFAVAYLWCTAEMLRMAFGWQWLSLSPWPWPSRSPSASRSPALLRSSGGAGSKTGKAAHARQAGPGGREKKQQQQQR
ncbi:Glucosyltransferase-like protein [Ascosphaera acerosa]|nr:Glucosyltransferase-like protein [Ascosphaera acerosa]